MKFYKNKKNKIFAFEDDGSQDDLIKKDMQQITKAEVDTIREQKQQERFNALSYAQKRAAEYPSITDQLDAIWKELDGKTQNAKATEMLNKVKAVKNKYPKEV